MELVVESRIAARIAWFQAGREGVFQASSRGWLAVDAKSGLDSTPQKMQLGWHDNRPTFGLPAGHARVLGSIFNAASAFCSGSPHFAFPFPFPFPFPTSTTSRTTRPPHNDSTATAQQIQLSSQQQS